MSFYGRLTRFPQISKHAIEYPVRYLENEDTEGYRFHFEDKIEIGQVEQQSERVSTSRRSTVVIAI